MAQTPDLRAPFRPLIDAAAEAERVEADRRQRADEATATAAAEAAERGAARQVAASTPGALLDAGQLAALLGVRRDRVDALGREGKIPRVALGKNTFRYRLESVTAAIEKLER
jgi:hypothetical protein